MKACSRCKTLQNLDQFSRDKNRKDGRHHVCRKCRRAYCEAHVDDTHNAHLLRKFGITLDDYNAMLQRQGGVCAICHRPPTGQRLAVDHSHSTGNNRGLLCFDCNVALGKFEDNPDRLRAAAMYLEEHGRV